MEGWMDWIFPESCSGPSLETGEPEGLPRLAGANDRTTSLPLADG
jgi:hypothetical protein